MNSMMFDKIFSFDPVEVDAQKNQPLMVKSESSSTLFHCINMLSTANLEQTKTSSLSVPSECAVGSECCLSGTDGYVLCEDCPCSSNSNTTCHCQSETV